MVTEASSRGLKLNLNISLIDTVLMLIITAHLLISFQLLLEVATETMISTGKRHKYFPKH